MYAVLLLWTTIRRSHGRLRVVTAFIIVPAGVVAAVQQNSHPTGGQVKEVNSFSFLESWGALCFPSKKRVVRRRLCFLVPVVESEFIFCWSSPLHPVISRASRTSLHCPCSPAPPPPSLSGANLDDNDHTHRVPALMKVPPFAPA